MNNESPLVPQGSFLDQKNKGRARVRIAVFIVLAIHGVGLMALLMQGCQKPPDTSSTTGPTNALAPDYTSAPLAPVLTPTNPPVVTDMSPIPPVTTQTSTSPSTVETPIVPPPVGTASTHKIVKGDTFDALARQYKVSTKAIRDANPGVDPARLKIDSIIQIPPPTAPTPGAGSPSAAPGASADANGSTGTTYKVKSGDTLIKIAGNYGVSVRALRSANGLRTDRIKVGDVLKIPVKNGGATGATADSNKP